MIPKKIKNILKQINKAGYEAYVVGGAVRDMVLGVEPHDWDITTNAMPDEIKKIFNKTIDTGLQHGTVTAMVDGEGFEITTYRIDGEYEDNRRPKEVIFTSKLSDDLKRRDLTINAMAADKDGNIVDLFGGQEDLKNGIIRAVGDANERIEEDALRMMRAIRFSAKLGFIIDEELFNAIKKNASLIQNISYERIEAEVTKIITSDYPEKFLDLYYLGLTKYIMPEFDEMMKCEQNTPWHLYNTGIHTIEAMKNIENDKILRWSMLLHDMGKPDCKITDEKGQDHFPDHPIKSTEMANEILKRYKFPTKELNEIKKLIYNHDLHLSKLKKIRLFAAKNGKEFVDKLYKIQLSDIAAQSEYKKDEKLNTAITMHDKLVSVIEDKTAITLKELKINGDDLIEIGFKGKEIGNVLNKLYLEAISNPNINNKDKLKKHAKKIYKDMKNEISKTNKDIPNKNSDIDR